MAVPNGPHPFAADARVLPSRPHDRYRIGWALVIAVLAESAIAGAAMTTDNHTIGIVATSTMSVCCVLLVAAEALTVNRTHR